MQLSERKLFLCLSRQSTTSLSLSLSRVWADWATDRGIVKQGDMAEAMHPNVRGPVHAVGMYICGASVLLLFCFLADILQGIRKRKFWFPCAWTRVNALTLSVMAIALKFPNDISTLMPGGADQLSKLSGTVLTCTFMAFSLPSVGDILKLEGPNEETAVTSKELNANLAALGVLVVTMVVNVCTQLRTRVIVSFRVEHMVVLVTTLLCLGYMCTACLAAHAFPAFLTTPPYIDSDDSRQDLERLMVARTGSSQYMVSRSSVGCAVGVLTSTSVAALVVAMARTTKPEYVTESDYGWTVWPILVVQILAILLGWIAVSVRWWRPIIFQEQRRISLKASCYGPMEGLWKMKLLEFRRKSVSLIGIKGIGKKQFMQLLWCLQTIAVDILIGWQIASVRTSKVVLAWSQWLCYCSSAKHKDPRKPRVSYQVSFLPGERPWGLWYSNILQQCRKLDDLRSKRSNITDLGKLLANAKGNPPTFESIRVLGLDRKWLPRTWSLAIVCLLTIMKALEKFYKDANQEEHHEVEIAFNGFTGATNMIKIIEEEMEDGMIERKAADEVLGELQFGRFLDLQLDLLQDHSRWQKWMDVQLQELLQMNKGAGEFWEHEVSSVYRRCAKSQGPFDEAMNILERLKATTDVKSRLVEHARDPASFAWESLRNVSATIIAQKPGEFNNLESLLLIVRTMIAEMAGACLTNFPEAVGTALWKAVKNNVESLCIEAIHLRLSWYDLWEELHWPQVSRHNFNRGIRVAGMQISPFTENASGYPSHRDNLDWKNRLLMREEEETSGGEDNYESDEYS